MSPAATGETLAPKPFHRCEGTVAIAGPARRESRRLLVSSQIHDGYKSILWSRPNRDQRRCDQICQLKRVIWANVTNIVTGRQRSDPRSATERYARGNDSR